MRFLLTMSAALVLPMMVVGCGGSDNQSTNQTSTPVISTTNSTQTTANTVSALTPRAHTIAVNPLRANAEYELVRYAQSEGVKFDSMDDYRIHLAGKTVDLKSLGKGFRDYDISETAKVTAGGRQYECFAFRQTVSVSAGFFYHCRCRQQKHGHLWQWR